MRDRGYPGEEALNREEWKAEAGKALDWFKAHPDVAKALAFTAFGIFLGFLFFH